MIRQMIAIDEEKCNGCGLCTRACQEGALALVDGKAKLIRDDYCDGLGNCLPACPTGAISFVMREAVPFDEEAAMEHVSKTADSEIIIPQGHSCQSTQPSSVIAGRKSMTSSELTHWPIQIKLAPTKASMFDGADILVAADCTAFAAGDFHKRFLKGKKVLIGCPKLDVGDYSEKLAQIFASNDVKTVTLVRMEVPCCSGLEKMVKDALSKSQKKIPYRVVILSRDGNILS